MTTDLYYIFCKYWTYSRAVGSHITTDHYLYWAETDGTSIYQTNWLVAWLTVSYFSNQSRLSPCDCTELAEIVYFQFCTMLCNAQLVRTDLTECHVFCTTFTLLAISKMTQRHSDASDSESQIYNTYRCCTRYSRRIKSIEDTG